MTDYDSVMEMLDDELSIAQELSSKFLRHASAKAGLKGGLAYKAGDKALQQKRARQASKFHAAARVAQDREGGRSGGGSAQSPSGGSGSRLPVPVPPTPNGSSSNLKRNLAIGAGLAATGAGVAGLISHARKRPTPPPANNGYANAVGAGMHYLHKYGRPNYDPINTSWYNRDGASYGYPYAHRDPSYFDYYGR